MKSIGVSNFRISDLKEILDHGQIKPAVNQIEYHPYVVNQDLVEFCQRNHIQVMSYSGLAPLIHFPGEPLDTPLNELCHQYSATKSQILQKWLLSQDIGIVTTTSKPPRIEELFQAGNVPLTEQDVVRITTVGLSSPKRKFWTDDWSN